MLRNFRGYGTVLAGFTAAIVALGSVSDPAHAFDMAIARASCTMIGIACAALVTCLFVKSDAKEKTLHRLRASISGIARRTSMPASTSHEERLRLGRPLVAEMIALDTQIEFAAAESADFRVHADGARSLLAHLFCAQAAKRALEAHLQREGLPAMPEAVAVYEDAMKALADGPRYMDADQWTEWEHELEKLRLRALELKPEESGLEKDQAVAARYVIDRVEELLGHCGRAAHDWKALQGRAVWKPSMRLDFHRDQRMACINAFRAFLAVLSAGMFWIVSAWSTGAAMLIQVAAACSLFSIMPYPSQQMARFLYGTMLAGAFALICDYYFLESVNGFPMLMLVLFIFLVPGGMLLLNPNTAAIGLAYCVLFLSMAQVDNVMNYDMANLINNILANVIAVIFGILAYLLLWPANAKAARRYVVHRIRKGLQNVSHLPDFTDTYLWQTRMFDRIQRLLDPANPAGTDTDEWFDGGVAALNLGNEILRLRQLEEEGKMSARVAAQVRAVLASFRHLVADPAEAREAINVALHQVREIPAADTPEARRAGFRARGSLVEMAAFFTDYPRFLYGLKD
jgi:uncharacterized membrane protein YccC